MREQDLKSICKKLKPALGRRADALWIAYATAETPGSKLQAEALINLLATQYLGSSVGYEPILLPPPSAEAAAGEFLLGTLHYGNKPVRPLYLRRENFIKHLLIASITGGGKSNVAQLLLLGLLNQDIPFLVVDWKRSYHTLRAVPTAKAKQIEVYSVGRKGHLPFHWNPLRGPPNVHPKTWISVVAEALEKSHLSGPGVADILIETLDKKFEQFGFYGGVPEQYPNFFDAAEELDRVQFRGRRMLWQDSAMRILRTFCFGPASGAFNARHPLKLEELLDKPVIVELDQELPKPLRVFLSDILLRWIHLYRLGRTPAACNRAGGIPQSVPPQPGRASGHQQPGKRVPRDSRVRRGAYQHHAASLANPDLYSGQLQYPNLPRLAARRRHLHRPPGLVSGAGRGGVSGPVARGGRHRQDQRPHRPVSGEIPARAGGLGR
jgi:hypothetical protein